MNKKSPTGICHLQFAISDRLLAIADWLSASFRNLQPATCNLQRSFYHTALALIALIFLTGCRGAPSINLFGSFFPAWMLCVAFGVIGVLLLRRVFVRTQIETHLGNRPLVYFSLWVLLTLGIWLLFFREL